MVRLETLIKLDSIMLDIAANTKREAMNALSHLLQTKGAVIDGNAFLADLMEKEQIETSNLGIGIAMPYTKSNSVREVSIAVGRLMNGISWDDNGEEVDAIMLIAIPEHDNDVQHLNIISSLASMLKEITFISDLYNASSEEELLNSIDNHIEMI